MFNVRCFCLSVVLALASAFAQAQPLAIRTFAGSISAGSTNGPAAGARFKHPVGLATDIGGNIYVADTENSTVRKITPGGMVSTLAGQAGLSGAVDGQGGAARFLSPQGIAVDDQGNVYVAEQVPQQIDSFNPSNFLGSFAALGTGQFNSPVGMAVDSSGNVYVADTAYNRVDRFNPTNVAGTFTTFGSLGSGIGQFHNPNAVAIDSTGNVYVADSLNDRIAIFDPTNFAGTGCGAASPANGANRRSASSTICACETAPAAEITMSGLR